MWQRNNYKSISIFGENKIYAQQKNKGLLSILYRECHTYYYSIKTYFIVICEYAVNHQSKNIIYIYKNGWARNDSGGGESQMKKTWERGMWIPHTILFPHILLSQKPRTIVVHYHYAFRSHNLFWFWNLKKIKRIKMEVAYFDVHTFFNHSSPKPF